MTTDPGAQPGQDDPTLTVVTAASSATWESAVVAGFDDRSDGIVVVRRCVDLADLLAVAASGLARTALIWPDLRFLDRDAVRRLADRSVAVVGVCDPGDDTRSRQRLADLGIASVVAADAGADVIGTTLRQAAYAVAVLPRPDSSGYADPARSIIPPRPPGRVTTGDVGPPAPTYPSAHGRVVAVWGPAGAPGRSTVALGLADEAARLGVPSLLVDADVYGGVISPMLGLLDESAGLATACRQAASARLDPPGLARLCQSVDGDFRILSGISRVDRWPEIRPAGLEAVLDAARALVPLTIVDCSFCTEEDEELSYDTAAPRRNAATVTVLENAQEVLCVARADPIGITRAVRSLVDLRERFPDLAPRVVANRVRDGVVSGSVPGQVDDAFRRFAGVGVTWFVPDDAKALDSALALGRTLSQTAPRSPARVAMQRIAADLAGVAVPSRRRR